MTTIKKQTGMPPGFWIGLVLLIILIFLPMTCEAQSCDTIKCHNECIQKIIPQKTKSGKIKFYVVYTDSMYKISDLIPVSNTVLEYMDLCKENGISPQLGIRFRNGQITSIVRYKAKYKRK